MAEGEIRLMAAFLRQSLLFHPYFSRDVFSLRPLQDAFLQEKRLVLFGSYATEVLFEFKW